MIISKLSFLDNLYLFFSSRITIIWCISLAVTWIPFFATDIEWKQFNQVSIEDGMTAFLCTLLCSWLVFCWLILSFIKKRSFLKRAQVAWGKATIDVRTASYVRSFRKAYRAIGFYEVDQIKYPIRSGLLVDVDFEKVYEFPVLYSKEHPEKGKILTELPKFLVKKLATANGLRYDELD